MAEYIDIKDIKIVPIKIDAYLPSIEWKGDCVGHIGGNDVFFWVLEGECFLLIDDCASVIRPGQLAYLPKGKKRMYTHASEKFCMYEMSFYAECDGENLMKALGFDEDDFVVTIPDVDEMTELFKSSKHTEMFKAPVYNIGWCANVLNIIKKYAEARSLLKGKGSNIFEPVLKYMAEKTNSTVTTEELAMLVYMQPTYFIRRFKNAFGVSPQNHFRSLKLFKAMNLLVSTDMSIEKIAPEIGIDDTAYFTRFFKKSCSVTPTEYRKAFKR